MEREALFKASLLLYMAIEEINQASSLPQLFMLRAKENSKETFLKKQYGSVIKAFTWKDIVQKVNSIANALIKAGLEKGQRVALMGNNGPKLLSCDLAVQAAGGSVTYIYSTSKAEEIRHILVDSQSAFFFFNKNLGLPHIKEALKDLKKKPLSVSIHDGSEGLGMEGVLDLSSFSEKSPDEPDLAEIDRRTANLTRDDLSSITYTSGTTGLSKGVMLTHGNLLSNLSGGIDGVKLNAEDTILSYLPMSHSFERTVGQYAIIASGAVIHYARSVATVSKDFMTARPTVAIVVPRFLEKMRQRVTSSIDAKKTLAKAVAKWALKIRIRKVRKEQNGESISIVHKAMAILADRLVMKKVRRRLGGRLRFLVSGSAAMALETWEFFEAVGITIIQGYGLTETSPIISANTLHSNKPKSVGKPINNMSVRIADDGEIEVSGPSVMKGYWNNNKATDETMTEDGWLKTGDVGVLDEDGHLYITDRKKDIIVTSSGKNIAPQKIEKTLCSNPLVDFACVMGDGKRFIGAILSPNMETLNTVATNLGIPEENPPKISENPKITTLYQDMINQVNSSLAPYEKIVRFRIADSPFSMERGELTPTMKVRRKQVEKNHKDLIHWIFNPGE